MSTSFHNISMIEAQLRFEASQYKRIQTLAFREKISIAEAVRRLVHKGLANGPTNYQNESVPGRVLLELAGIASTGEPDLGRNHDQHLKEDFPE